MALNLDQDIDPNEMKTFPIPISRCASMLRKPVDKSSNLLVQETTEYNNKVIDKWETALTKLGKDTVPAGVVYELFETFHDFHNFKLYNDFKRRGLIVRPTNENVENLKEFFSMPIEDIYKYGTTTTINAFRFLLAHYILNNIDEKIAKVYENFESDISYEKLLKNRNTFSTLYGSETIDSQMKTCFEVKDAMDNMLSLENKLLEEMRKKNSFDYNDLIVKIPKYANQNHKKLLEIRNNDILEWKSLTEDPGFNNLTEARRSLNCFLQRKAVPNYMKIKDELFCSFSQEQFDFYTEELGRDVSYVLENVGRTVIDIVWTVYMNDFRNMFIKDLNDNIYSLNGELNGFDECYKLERNKTPIHKELSEKVSDLVTKIMHINAVRPEP